jgi:hypothetical protein
MIRSTEEKTIKNVTKCSRGYLNRGGVLSQNEEVL